LRANRWDAFWDAACGGSAWWWSTAKRWDALLVGKPVGCVVGLVAVAVGGGVGTTTGDNCCLPVVVVVVDGKALV
jgi:hypothetical protein